MARKKSSTVMPTSGIQAYLQEIGRTPLLTPDQEIDLARKVQRMRVLEQRSDGLTASERYEVVIGKRAMEKFVTANLRLVVSVAKRYVSMTRSLDLMDLIQEGNAGLIQGVLKFDPERGYRFSTYSYWWVRQAMTRAIRYRDRAIRLPGNISDMAYAWNHKVQKLTVELGREPKVAELAEAFSVSVEDVELFRNRGHHPTSLDMSVGLETESSLIDCIQDPSNIGGVEAMEMAEFSEMSGILRDALGLLSDKDRDLVISRWGLDGRPAMTYNEIGDRYGVTREAIRQSLVRAQNRLRLLMRERKSTALTA
jgi:RNA polymerase sigma factor (sigma-70 family)